MSTIISPYNSLSDTLGMYQHLKAKINEANDFDALFQFVPFLTTLDEFKSNLISLMEEKYTAEDDNKQNEQDNKNNTSIRPLYISQFQLNGIPSDVMHANIISYLPSKDYTTLPLVCKHFHHIMNNYPFIYNEKGYKVVLGRTIEHEKLEINIDHIKKHIIITSKTFTTLSSKSLNSFKFPVHKIKHWEIHHLNSFIKELISKAQNSIQKLSFGGDPVTRFSIANQVLDNMNGWYFNQCKVISIEQEDYDRLPTITDDFRYFENVQLLEVFIVASKYNYYNNYGTPKLTSEFFANLNNILGNLEDSLKCLVVEDFRKDTGTNYIDSNDDDTKPCIKVPEYVEWLKIKCDVVNRNDYDTDDSTDESDDDLVQIDVSKCNKLIGMKFGRKLRMKSVVYAKDYVIPFAHFSGLIIGGTELKHCNIRFFCGHVVHKTSGCKINDVKVQLEDIHDTTDKELLCLELGSTQVNDKKENLMQKLLEFVFDDEKVRIDKMEEYSRWWSLGSALWIQNCAQVDQFS